MPEFSLLISFYYFTVTNYLIYKTFRYPIWISIVIPGVTASVFHLISYTLSMH